MYLRIVRTMRSGCICAPDLNLICARRPMMNFTCEPPTSMTRMRCCEGAFARVADLPCILLFAIAGDCLRRTDESLSAFRQLQPGYGARPFSAPHRLPGCAPVA